MPGGYEIRIITIRLLPETEFLHDGAVTIDLRGLKIIEQPAAMSHHAQETPARVVIRLVDLEVFRKVLDLLRQERDLDFGGTRVVFVELELPNNALLLFLC
jgi:hypothetical protein